MTILPYASDLSDLTEGYVYEWTNTLNGKQYIGSHNGSNPKYHSSGKAINKAFIKYGIENFTRAILYVGPRFREVETEMLKAIRAKQSPRYYNQHNGKYVPSYGYSTAGAKNGMYGKTQSEETRALMSEAKLGVSRVTDWLVGVPRPETSNVKTGTTMKLRWHEKGAHETKPREGCPSCTLVQ